MELKEKRTKIPLKRILHYPFFRYELDKNSAWSGNVDIWVDGVAQNAALLSLLISSPDKVGGLIGQVPIVKLQNC